RPGFVKRPFWPEHTFHEARLRTGEDVADVALMLDGGPHRMFDRSAVEAGDRLEFVEGDDDRSPADFGEPAGQGEDLLGEPGNLPLRTRPWKRHGEKGSCPFSQVRRKGVGPLLEVDFGTGRANGLAEPGSRPIPACFGGDERPRVALEEGDIGAEAADGDVDRQRAAPADGGERVPDERRFAGAARRDEEAL